MGHFESESSVKEARMEQIFRFNNKAVEVRCRLCGGPTLEIVTSPILFLMDPTWGPLESKPSGIYRCIGDLCDVLTCPGMED